ncbi:Heme NO binding domain protein [Sulfitobacter noctilucae]|uniref:heme NO-binding domain-containing protein n=1 Tax=Sulfitobacter noctilucae TaxID=1342302 RepID=UPI0004686080|nr:heme NO-binding domain-containing protein [Sulfitobacter noctilucae]KIN61609.1 Heme NO binding domain protein [Sulfitobacter noctilucae]
MHGLVNRSIQLFVSHTYGVAQWEAVTRAAGLDFTEFEGMLRYERTYTPTLLDAAAEVLRRPRADLMEDLGSFLVCHPGFEAVRRLLRFGGVDFVDFLHSLDDLDDRVRMALSDLRLPKLELRVHGEGHFSLLCEAQVTGYGYVMMGVLRAMADDYGALALLDHTGAASGVETLSITLIENDFAEGRSFELGACVG